MLAGLLRVMAVPIAWARLVRIDLCLQLSGAFLLAYSVVSRTSKDVVSLCTLIAPVASRRPVQARRILLETYLSRAGFSYLLLGYALQAVYPLQGRAYSTAFVLATAVLATGGVYGAFFLSHRAYESLPPWRPPGHIG